MKQLDLIFDVFSNTTKNIPANMLIQSTGILNKIQFLFKNKLLNSKFNLYWHTPFQHRAPGLLHQ